MSRRNSRSNSKSARPARSARRNKQKVVFDNRGNAIKNNEDDFQFNAPTGRTQSNSATPRSKSVSYNDIKELEPLTDNQAIFFETYYDVEAFVLHGSAGTGKTMMALYHGLMDVLDPEEPVDKLIIIRSIASARDIGFLPGLEEKFAPYEAPYESIITDLTGKKSGYEFLKEIGKLEFHPTSFLRGLTFNDCVVILDEAQNCNWQELSTILSRIGSNTKLIICGDSKQNDLLYNKNDQSGFGTLLEVTRIMPEFRSIRFTSEDIVRSGFSKSFIMACEKIGV
jgi:phosphate starvation-inducible protein PhoH and related proteins